MHHTQVVQLIASTVAAWNDVIDVWTQCTRSYAELPRGLCTVRPLTLKLSHLFSRDKRMNDRSRLPRLEVEGVDFIV